MTGGPARRFGDRWDPVGRGAGAEVIRLLSPGGQGVVCSHHNLGLAVSDDKKQYGRARPVPTRHGTRRLSAAVSVAHPRNPISFTGSSCRSTVRVYAPTACSGNAWMPGGTPVAKAVSRADETDDENIRVVNSYRADQQPR
jgi:hypothetical protein